MAAYGGGGGYEAFAGGGFMPSQQHDQGGGGSGGNKGRSKEQTLRALTVRQLLTATAAMPPADSDLVVDNHDISNVTLVGRIVNQVERSSNELLLELHDGTGVIEASVHVHDADPQVLVQRKAELRPGVYVRVYGHMKNFNGRWSVNTFVVRVIHDHNEVTYHLLQACFQHLHLLKGGGTGTGAAPGLAGAKLGGPGGNGYGGPAAGGWAPPPQPQQHYGGGPPAAGGGGGRGGGAGDCQSAVMGVISDPGNAQGMHVNEISARLAPQGFSRQQVEAALQFLQNEAHAYTTCDDNHWRSTT